MFLGLKKKNQGFKTYLLGMSFEWEVFSLGQNWYCLSLEFFLCIIDVFYCIIIGTFENQNWRRHRIFFGSQCIKNDWIPEIPDV